MRTRARGCRWLPLLAFALSGAACADVRTPAEAIAACERDPASMCCGPGECGQGSECDFSVVCAQDSDHKVTCDLPTGDRQCHTLCDTTTVCASGQMCQQVSLFDTSDVGRGVSFCRPR
jgi:hypothetical protein